MQCMLLLYTSGHYLVWVASTYGSFALLTQLIERNVLYSFLLSPNLMFRKACRMPFDKYLHDFQFYILHNMTYVLVWLQCFEACHIYQSVCISHSITHCSSDILWYKGPHLCTDILQYLSNHKCWGSDLLLNHRLWECLGIWLDLYSVNHLTLI